MNADFVALFNALRPESALVVGALVILGLDLSLFRQRTRAERLHYALLLGALAVAVAIWHACHVGAVGPVFAGALMLDRLAVAARIGVLGLTLLTLGVARGASVPRHPAEYVAILLFATVGFTLMAAAQQLLLAFLALELASLSLYVLTGYDKTRPESAEAALKYFLFGGVSAAFLLFGFSLIYGLTGSIEFGPISRVLASQPFTPLLSVALTMVLVGFGFKAAAAPFHLWAPDAYQGAPTPSAALIASGSKLAGLVLFTRLLTTGLRGAAGELGAFIGPGWLPVVGVLIVASLLLGNLAALAQTSVRRLLAYSAIAHAGVMLLGVIPAGISGPGPLVYYAFTYGIATAGAFGVIGVLESHGRIDAITDLAGLHRRSPLLAGCLLLFILSLAGVPPLAGFFGKFTIFAAALRIDGLYVPAGWYALLGIALSAVALYYYLLILKQALIAEPASDAPAIRVPPITALTLVAAALALIILGVRPSLVLAAF